MWYGMRYQRHWIYGWERQTVYTLFMSYPETFFTALPPPFVTSPFGLTTFIPINLSLIAPNCARIGPLELVDRMPSMVALSA